MGAVFAMFSGWYFWVPKLLGLNYNIFLSKIQYWILFIGVNLTFFPQHFLGLQGMPRRISDYPDAFSGWNLISSFGSIVSVFSAFVFLYVIYIQLERAEAASRYPWLLPQFHTDALQALLSRNYPSLEWALSSPPKPHAFVSLPLQSFMATPILLIDTDSDVPEIEDKSPDSQGESSKKDLSDNSSQSTASELKSGTCFDKSYVFNTKNSDNSPNDSSSSNNSPKKFNYEEFKKAKAKRIDQIMGIVRNELVIAKHQGKDTDQEIIDALTPSFAAELKISKDDTSNENKSLKRPSDNNDKLLEHSTKKRGSET